MPYLTWQRLTLVAVITGALAWLITRLAAARGFTPLPVPWSAMIAAGIGAGVALWLAWTVRQYQRGDRPGLDALRAARTAVLAQAAAYAGALLTGGYGGYALGLAIEWQHAPRREVAVSALIGVLSGVVLLVAGIVAERWCRTGGGDDDGTPDPA
jgi:hypothetical protein